jgi:hypothetical protein
LQFLSYQHSCAEGRRIESSFPEEEDEKGRGGETLIEKTERSTHGGFNSEVILVIGLGYTFKVKTQKDIGY